MNTLWSYFWPAIGAGLAVGIDRRSRSPSAPSAGAMRRSRSALVATLALAALWHGPLGARRPLRRAVERGARTTLDLL